MRSIYLALIIFVFSGCTFTPENNRLILDAQELIFSNRYAEAAKLYRSVLDNKPSQEIKVKVAYQLAKLYATHLDDQKKAVELFEIVVNQSSDPLWQVRSVEEMAEINFAYLKNYQACITLYKRLLAFEPKLSRYDFYEYRLAQSYLELRDYENANKTLVQILKSPRHQYFKDSYYLSGLMNFEQGKWKKAIFIWREYLAREDQKDSIVKTKFFMANAYETLEKLEQAYNLYYSILNDYPNPDVIRNRLSAIYDRRIARKR